MSKIWGKQNVDGISSGSFKCHRKAKTSLPQLRKFLLLNLQNRWGKERKSFSIISDCSFRANVVRCPGLLMPT